MSKHQIEACEDFCGDPCYVITGHIDLREAQEAVASLSDYGEDAETAESYSYSHTYRASVEPSKRFPEGGWECSSGDDPRAVPVTLAATWVPKRNDGVAC